MPPRMPTAVVVAVMGSMGYDADLSDVDKLGDLGLRTAFAAAMARAFQVSVVMMFVAVLLSLAAPSSAGARAPAGAPAAKHV